MVRNPRVMRRRVVRGSIVRRAGSGTNTVKGDAGNDTIERTVELLPARGTALLLPIAAQVCHAVASGAGASVLPDVRGRP